MSSGLSWPGIGTLWALVDRVPGLDERKSAAKCSAPPSLFQSSENPVLWDINVHTPHTTHTHTHHTWI